MVQDCCQKVGPLQKLGAFGVTLTAAQKKILMAVAFCLTGLSWILTIVAMVGSSTDNDVVKNCAWTYQEYQGMDIYYGTYRAVAEGYGTTTGVEYSDCTDDACNDCETAGITATNCAVLTFILLFFFAAFSALRMVNKFDCVTVKTTFIVLSLINVLIMIIGMGSWNDQCVESHIKNGDVTLGPGLNCYVATFFLMLMATAIHLITPTDGSSSDTAAETTTTNASVPSAPPADSEENVK